MDLSKLTYTKVFFNREPKESILIKTVKKEQKKISVSSEIISPLYQKDEGVLSTKLIFVLSGGEKKEKDFLKELIRQKNLHSLRVDFMSQNGQGLQPNQMQTKWQDIRKFGEFEIAGQLYHLDSMDKVFMLTDVDEFYEQLQQILKVKAVDDGCEWVISNPCFEIWLYYCFLNNPEEDLSCLVTLDVKHKSQRLKRMGHKLVIGGLNPILAFEHMEKGIEYSRQHYVVDECGVPKLLLPKCVIWQNIFWTFSSRILMNSLNF